MSEQSNSSASAAFPITLPAKTTKKNAKEVKEEVKGEEVKGEEVKGEENKKLSMLLTFCGAGVEHEVYIIPVPSKSGVATRGWRYDGQGGLPYKTNFDEQSTLFADLRLVSRIVTPTTISVFYKGMSHVWMLHPVLTQLKVEQDLLHTLSGHDCSDKDCEPDAHDMTRPQFTDFVLDKIYAIITDSMEKDSQRLYKEERIKDKECPVLLEPLRVNQTIYLSCGHYISREAWTKQQGTRCPLCRQDGHGRGFEYL